jgi:hypothetical protein
MRNKFEFFTPLMHDFEYKMIEKYINKDDVFLEWGSGNSTIYFSGLVKKLITIEHDLSYFKQIDSTIKMFDIKNIDNILIVSKVNLIPTKENRYKVFEEYINYPKNNNLEFTKVLVDGRSRKHCALSILDMIDENVIVFIHDFNHNDVEGYSDDTYFDEILEHYDIVERVTDGQGIVALRKKIM